MAVTWSDEVDEILTGDLAAGFAYLTPAKGVVIAPMAPLALRDRDAGTVSLTTSLGLWKKLDRVRRNPGVAVAYHAREHGFSERSGFVVVQGRASFSPTPDRAWLESITPNWDRFLVPKLSGALGRPQATLRRKRMAAGCRMGHGGRLGQADSRRPGREGSGSCSGDTVAVRRYGSRAQSRSRRQQPWSHACRVGPRLRVANRFLATPLKPRGGWSFSGTTTLPSIKCEGGLLGSLAGPILSELISGAGAHYSLSITP